ncbi:hypothetical protein J8J14_19895 [Roseomonas sp. SSH11]|uniref:Uncharacterized protein n=1 Tax=Pararoseomonas baculiformis TaxID=2820812 RepID=A0ABS4AJI4_9PROT|nr:hypothetical protein [Pararoseomonas baculiformis]MBP0447041.1 hypothetical protein [Pararoseomonas baculiformis]
MLSSRPISVEGRFVGVAVARELDWVFLATDPVLEDLQGAAFPDPAEATRVARLVLLRGQGRMVA